jgi:DNA-binding NarL/FixJ family response regulator
MVRENIASGALIGIDAIQDAYLIVRKDRRIVFANAAAETLLSSACTLKQSSGALYLSDKNDDERLALAIHDASTNRGGGQSSFAIRSSSDGVQWRFTLTPKSFEGETLVLVWIDRCQVGASAHQAMQQVYGLTEAELPILMAITEGLSASEIAERLQISVATVRTHIQHIYQKTGVRKATQLATLVSTMPKVR